jgi:hypothetical protein
MEQTAVAAAKVIVASCVRRCSSPSFSLHRFAVLELRTDDPGGFGHAVYRAAACPPGSLCILFLDDCPSRNLREMPYLVIHISPQFAAP